MHEKLKTRFSGLHKGEYEVHTGNHIGFQNE